MLWLVQNISLEAMHFGKLVVSSDLHGVCVGKEPSKSDGVEGLLPGAITGMWLVEPAMMNRHEHRLKISPIDKIERG